MKSRPRSLSQVVRGAAVLAVRAISVNEGAAPSGVDQMLWLIVCGLLPSGAFILGYLIGRAHERQGWRVWLESKRS